MNQNQKDSPKPDQNRLRDMIDTLWTRRFKEAIEDISKPITNAEWSTIMDLCDKGLLRAGLMSHVAADRAGDDLSAEDQEEGEGSRPLPSRSKWLRDNGRADSKPRAEADITGTKTVRQRKAESAVKCAAAAAENQKPTQ